MYSSSSRHSTRYSSQPYSRPSRHASPIVNRTPPTSTTQYGESPHQDRTSKSQVEMLSASLGVPDVFPINSDKKKPEFIFSVQHIRGEGYRVKYDTSQWGTFILGTKSRSDAVVGEKKKDEFYKKIAALDQKLREGWRTYSTKKTRAEKREQFQNATISCKCTNPKVGFPSLLLNFSDKDKWINNLANQRSSLKELASQLPHGYRMKNLIQVLSSKKIPLLHAAWFIKLMCLNQFKDKTQNSSRNLTNQWTSNVIENLETLLKQGDRPASVVYILQLIVWCTEEGLIEPNELENWTISRLKELFGKNITPKKSSSLVQTSTHAHQDTNWFLDAVFDVPKDVETVLQSCIQLVEKKLKHDFVRLEILRDLIKLRISHSPHLYHTIRKIVKMHNLSERSRSGSGIEPDSSLQVVEVMDKLVCDGNMDDAYNSIFGNLNINMVPVVCEWACTSKRFNPYRPYIAATLISRFNSELINIQKKNLPLQDLLFSFLTNSFSHLVEEHEKKNIYKLFGELIRLGVFSHDQYIKTLIARGICYQFNDSPHRQFIDQIPLYNPSTHVINQRRIILYGPTGVDIDEKIINDLKIRLCNALGIPLDGSNVENSNNLELLLSTISSTSMYNVFSVTEFLSGHIKGIIDKIDEEIIGKVLTVLEYVGDMWTLLNLVKWLLSVSTPFDSFIFSCAVSYQDLFVAFNQINDLLILLLKKCEAQKISQRMTADGIRLITSRYKELVKLDVLKREFPCKSMDLLLDGLNTPSSPLSSNRITQSKVELNEELSPQLKSIVKEAYPTNLDISQSLQQTVNKIRQQKTYFQKKDVILLFKYVMELYLSFLESSQEKGFIYISLLRELYAQECFTSSDICDALTHIIQEKLDSTSRTAVTGAVIFLVACVIRGLLAPDMLVNRIIRNILKHLLEMLTLSSEGMLKLSSKMVKTAKIHFWFLYLILTSKQELEVINSSKLSFTEKIWFKMKKYSYNPAIIPKIVNVIVNFAKQINKFPVVSDGIIEVLCKIFSEHKILSKLACRTSILREIFKALTGLSMKHKQQTTDALVSGLYSQYNIQNILEHHASIDNVISYIKSTTEWTLWLNSIYLHHHLTTLKSKNQLTADVLTQLLSPLTSQFTNEDQQIHLYSHMITAQCSHQSELKQRLSDEFLASLSLDDKLGVRLNTKKISILGHTLIKSTTKHDSALFEKICNALGTNMRLLLKKSESVPIFQQDSKLRTMDHFQQLQERLCTLLKLLKEAIIMTKSIPANLITFLLDLIDHRLINTPLANGNDNADISPRSQLYSVLIYLNEQPNHTVRSQIQSFCEQRIKQIYRKDDPDPSVNWRSIEDYVATCVNCRAKHANQTPGMYGGRLVQRSWMLFDPNAEKRKREAEEEKNEPHHKKMKY